MSYDSIEAVEFLSSLFTSLNHTMATQFIKNHVSTQWGYQNLLMWNFNSSPLPFVLSVIIEVLLNYSSGGCRISRAEGDAGMDWIRNNWSGQSNRDWDSHRCFQDQQHSGRTRKPCGSNEKSLQSELPAHFNFQQRVYS